MKDSFTLNDFILYSNSNELKRKDEMIEAYCKDGDTIPAAPDKRIISNILSYSRALTVIKTKRVGTLNLLMN